MAAVAVAAATWGRDASGLRVLALAVVALVLVDPLLVRSLGFQLSVAASLGIVALGRRLADRLPGPEWLRAPVAVSLAAQLGVGPLLLAAFGRLPVVAPLANLLAVPAAGPISTWGLTAGVVAGVVPAWSGGLHLPTRVLVGWVAGVARLAVRLPLGQLGPLSFAAAVALGAAALLARGRGRPARTRLALLALVAVLLAPAIRLHTVEPAAQVDVAADAALWRSEGRALVVLGGRVREDDLLAGLRERGVDRLDVIVCRTPAASLVVVVRDLQRRYGRAVVLAPEGSPVVGAEPPPEGATVAVGGLLASIAVEPDRLTVVVEPSGGVDGGSV